MSGVAKIIEPISSTIFGMFGGNKTPSPPPIEKPPVMPLPDDEAAKKAKRRSIVEQQARSGRAATIFTNDDPLGGA